MSTTYRCISCSRDITRTHDVKSRAYSTSSNSCNSCARDNRIIFISHFPILGFRKYGCRDAKFKPFSTDSLQPQAKSKSDISLTVRLALTLTLTVFLTGIHTPYCNQDADCSLISENCLPVRSIATLPCRPSKISWEEQFFGAISQTIDRVACLRNDL